MDKSLCSFLKGSTAFSSPDITCIAPHTDLIISDYIWTWCKVGKDERKNASNR